MMHIQQVHTSVSFRISQSHKTDARMFVFSFFSDDGPVVIWYSALACQHKTAPQSIVRHVAQQVLSQTNKISLQQSQIVSATSKVVLIMSLIVANVGIPLHHESRDVLLINKGKAVIHRGCTVQFSAIGSMYAHSCCCCCCTGVSMCLMRVLRRGFTCRPKKTIILNRSTAVQSG